MEARDFPDGRVVKNPACNAEDMSWIPGWGTEIPRAPVEDEACALQPESPEQRGRSRMLLLRPDAAK